MVRKWAQTGVFCMMVAWAMPVSAQQILPNIEPGRMDERFEQKAPPASSLKPSILGPISNEAGQALDADITFVLQKVTLKGNNAIPDAELFSLYSEFLKKEIPLAVLQTIAERITHYYREKGYVLSRAIVPPQQIDDGVVTIQVLEGFIDKVRFKGNSAREKDALNAYIKMLASKPANLKDLERSLLLMNDLPGFTVQGTLAPSPDTVGASDLIISIEEDTFTGHVGIDNRGSRYLGPLQGNLYGAANNILGMNEKIDAHIVGTLNWEELKYGLLSYTQPIGPYGTTWGVMVSHSLTYPGAGLRTLDIEGKSSSVGFSVTHPIIRTREHNMNLRVGGNWRESESQTLGTDVFEDHIRAVFAELGYDRADSWQGVSQIAGTFTQGLDVLGANDANDLVSRSNADPGFSKLELDASRSQYFGEGWSGLVRLSGQYAYDPLFSAEEFSVGGQGFGSAYDASEISGDHGVAARAEVRYHVASPPPWTDNLQIYGFYDGGVVWNDKVLAGEEKRSSLTSTGVGSRFSITEDLSASFELGMPLTRDVSAEGSGGDVLRGFFSISQRL